MFQINNSIFSYDGKIKFFGYEHFIKEIVKGNHCFICGISPDEKTFNDEHIIPQWVLKRFKLHSKSVTLTNGTQIKYGQYKIPCCKDCNTQLGIIYEKPLAKLFSKSYFEISNEIKNNKELARKIFIWLTLLYLKTHLKDKTLLIDRDFRKKSKYIGENHFWNDMHHVHCIARSHYSDATIDSNVFGSLLIYPSITDGFDYIDSHIGKTIMVQVGKIYLIANINDASAVLSVYKEQIEKINGPLSPHQAREITAYFNFIYVNLKNPPSFQSIMGLNNEYKITAKVPEVWYLFDKKNWRATAGKFLRIYVEHFSKDIENKEEYLNDIESGKRNYLFDENGKFINHS